MSDRSRTSNDEINKENEENEKRMTEEEKSIMDLLNSNEQKYKSIEHNDPIRYKNLDSYSGKINKKIANLYDIDYDKVKNMPIGEFRKSVRDNDIERFKNVNTDYRPIQELKRGITKSIAEKYNVPWEIAKNYKSKNNFVNYLEEQRKLETIEYHKNQINTVHESKDKAGNKMLYLQYDYLHDNKKNFSEKLKQLMENFGTNDVNISLMANPEEVRDYDAKIYKKHFRHQRTSTISDLIKFFSEGIDAVYDNYYRIEYAYIVIAPVKISYNKKSLKMGNPLSNMDFNCIFNIIDRVTGNGDEYVKKYNKLTNKNYKPSIKELSSVASDEGINIKFYTPISEILNEPFCEIRRRKPIQTISVVVENEHARFKYDIMDNVKKIYYYNYNERKFLRDFNHNYKIEQCKGIDNKKFNVIKMYYYEIDGDEIYEHTVKCIKNNKKYEIYEEQKEMMVYANYSGYNDKIVRSGYYEHIPGVKFNDYYEHDAEFEDFNILFVRSGYYENTSDIKFYDYKNDCLSLLKSFKPSIITNNVDDDTNPDYFNCFNESSLLYRKWCIENDFKPIKNDFINDILKKACKTCGFFRYEDFDKNNFGKYLEIDHNRSYSYATCAKNNFYYGVPCNWMELYKYNEGDDLTNMIFVYVTSIEYPEKYKLLPLNYDCLGRPMYEFMLSIGCKIVIDSVIYGDLKHLTDQPTLPNPKECKFMQNMHIGKLITGGIDQLETKKYVAYNENERLAAIDQLNKHKIPYTHDPTNENIIYFKVPIKKQIYHVYAYIVQYSQIAIMQMMIKLQDLGHNIKAGNCDALMINYTDKLPDLTGFKTMSGIDLDYEKNHLYRYYAPKSKLIEFKPIIKNEPLDTVNRPPIIGNKLIISGPAGCGKGYNYIRNSDSRYTMIVSPTHKRKRENAELNSNSHTIQMLIKRINMHAANYPIKKLIIDEYTQNDNKTINDIINWADERNINIVMLGDHCQLFNDITNDKIDLNKLTDSGFKIVNFERGNISRQECPDFAKWLDSLRWGINDVLDYKKFAYGVCLYFGHKNKKYYLKLMAINPDKYIYISEQHYELYKYNKLLNKKNRNINIDCINVNGDKNNRGKIVKIPIRDINIKWDRKSMNDRKSHIYEPFTTSTVYSIQGDTIKNKTVVIDVRSFTTVNALYTAITRTVKKSQIVLV